MSLTSLTFIMFLLAVVILYYAVPKKIQWIVLLLVSYGFYASFGLSDLLFILFTTLFTYLSGRFMQKLREGSQLKISLLPEDATKDDKRAIKKATQKKIHTVQVVTVLVNLGVLAYLKFFNVLAGYANHIFGLFEWNAAIPFINIIAPVGLSYYTFNSIGYLIDIGRGKISAEKNIGKFALFVSFFPSIIQGPLYRYGDVGTQLGGTHKLEYNNLKYGAQLILWGFFKKLVIADRVAPVVSTVFNKGGFDYTSGTQIFFGLLMYSLQIYGDFSGGIDITRGAAEMLGINLPPNFERPFFATSLADFWKRWHMSLGAWMREFVFFPVMLCKPVTAVSKRFRKWFGPYAGKIVPSVAAPLVVFFLIGIWHGITKQYIVNGFYNAIVIASSVALAPVYEKLAKLLKVNTKAFSFKLFQMVRTFFVVGISRIIVKAPNLSEAFRMIKSMFTSFDLGFFTGAGKYSLGIDRRGLIIIALSVIVLLVVGILQENGLKIREALSRQNIWFRWGLIFLLLGVVIVFGIYGPAYDARDFIYGRF